LYQLFEISFCKESLQNQVFCGLFLFYSDLHLLHFMSAPSCAIRIVVLFLTKGAQNFTVRPVY
jgi:hypothetical protein